jgi:hypothetical protein
MTLLYRLCEWHALAKLRMHTDSTLSLMDAVTTTLGRELRTFRDVTCAAFVTTELPKEAAARGRRQRKAQAKAGSVADNHPPPNPTAPNAAPVVVAPSSISSGPLPSPHATTAAPSPPIKKKKTLKISTYKFHALADYVRTIRMFGTTDSYSTQTVCTPLYPGLRDIVMSSFCRESSNIAASNGYTDKLTKTKPFDR